MNPSTAQAEVIVDELTRCGVTDAVLCPGSRNAPLSFALHAADAAGRLRLHVRIDERTAGFLALGLALRSGRAVPVCTTSGTAAANLHPAVLEAAHAGVPLLALTADRPPQLVGTGANQTIAQPGLFGDAVRLAAGVAVAVDPATEHPQWRALVGRAMAAATGAWVGPPGPVHLNLPFAEPLVPDGDGVPPPGRPGGGPWTTVGPVERSAPLLPLDPRCRRSSSPATARPPRWPGCRPRSSPSAASPAWPGALRAGPWLPGSDPALRPAQVVVAGRPTLHRRVQRLLADPAVAVSPSPTRQRPRWPDVAATVRAVGAVPSLTPADGVDSTAGRRRPRGDQRARRGPRRAGSARRPAAGPGVRRRATGGAALVVGSSNPVRDVALGALPRPGRHGAGQPRCGGHRRHGVHRRSVPRWPTDGPTPTRCWAT